MVAVAAEGWGGGTMNVYTLGGGEKLQGLLHVALVWDSSADLEEFEAAFKRAVALSSTRLLRIEPDRSRWFGPSYFGYAFWDVENRRVDLLFSAEEGPMLAARNAPQRLEISHHYHFRKWSPSPPKTMLVSPPVR